MAVGEGGEEGKVGCRPPATCRSRRAPARGVQRRQADVEDVVEDGDILAGDAVASGRLAHRLAERYGRRLADVVRAPRCRARRARPGTIASKASSASAMRQLRKHRRQAAAQAARRARPRRERRAQQHDAEIGVGADRRAGRRDRATDARADACARAPRAAAAEAAALARKAAAVMPWPSAKTWTLPGFSASISARQAAS